MGFLASVPWSELVIVPRAIVSVKGFQQFCGIGVGRFFLKDGAGGGGGMGIGWLIFRERFKVFKDSYYKLSFTFKLNEKKESAIEIDKKVFDWGAFDD